MLEAVEVRSLEDDAVLQGAPVELHVGEVLEQDVDRLEVGTLLGVFVADDDAEPVSERGPSERGCRR